MSQPAEAFGGRRSEDDDDRQRDRRVAASHEHPRPGNSQSLLSEAHAVAIIPGVTQGAFVVGIRKGYGVLISKDDQGSWRAPQFIDLTGGSIGWQAGVQSTDVILVFRSRESLAGLMRGKLTIGVDASVAAGPVGRTASAGTDLQLRSEILSYSRSRGAFLGAAFEGSSIQPDPLADARYYYRGGSYGNQGPARVPEPAVRLVSQIAALAGGNRPLARRSRINRIDITGGQRRRVVRHGTAESDEFVEPAGTRTRASLAAIPGSTSRSVQHRGGDQSPAARGMPASV